MTHQRIDDYDAFRAFQSLVFEATERFAARVDLTTLNDVVVAPPYGPTIVNTFSALVRGDTGITRSDALECWIYQHALRHLGEVEHARALVGLSGLTSQSLTSPV